jgi:lipopolysaccharide/colanic/teichoic acid biosynthesis glycosyltransferase
MKSIIPLIIDSEVPYLCQSEPAPLLTLPLGLTSVLDHLAPLLAPLAAGDVLVMPAFEAPADYESLISASTSASVRVVRRDHLTQVLSDLEIGDDLLVIEPRHWIVGDRGFEQIVTSLEDYRGATHVVATRFGVDDVQERVECDSFGMVKRVQRFYSAVEGSDVGSSAVVCTLVPARSVAGIRFASLSELRSGLLAKGGLNRDLPLEVNFLDLSTPAGLLALNDRVLEQIAHHDAPPTFEPGGREIRVGRECEIHPSARLVPPVIIHPGVILEEEVTIIGPALIGAGSRVGRGATVAQSYLKHGTELLAGVTVRHHVCDGHCVGSFCACGGPAEHSPAAALPEARWQVKELKKPSDQTDSGRRPFHRAAKRLIDGVLAFLGLVVLSPVMLVVGLLVKLDSAGPVFFAHRREGRGGKEFSCLKFRTMTADAHRLQRRLYQNNEVDGPQFKMKKDPRVTRVGRLLRVTNLDEIPQLLNVLLGHMSLVGPRPSPFRENQICVPWRRARLSVRPGITGLWQVCRDEDRNEGDFHEWIYYDLTYVRHFSVWLDLKILLATIVTLGGRSSAPITWFVRRPDRGAASVQPAAV